VSEVPLRLGPLRANGYSIRRSGIRWMCESGETCEANQVVAYFNIAVKRDGPPGLSSAFADEHELYVACATRARGRIQFAPAPGGYLSMLGLNPWDAESVFGSLSVDDSRATLADDAGTFSLMMLAGRRMSALADVQAGLLGSWYGRARAWWSDDRLPVTLLSLGICDVTGVVSGAERAFFELFRSEPQATHVVFVPDHPIAPAAPVLLDQLERTANDAAAIANDIRSALARGTPNADDLIFAGTLVATMQRNPMRETHDLLVPSGLARSSPADAVLLSLSAEPPVILRHKKLGYRLHILQHNQHAIGPVLKAWLTQAFESVPRTTSDIKADYERLFDAMERTTGALPIVLNRMSTSGDETLSNYAAFDAPLSGTLANVEAKELNLMLHDIAATREIAVIDVDAIAAEIGGAQHLPDGIHQSGAMQSVLREEILRVLRPLRADLARDAAPARLKAERDGFGLGEPAMSPRTRRA
jgi:hypothetical protein